MTLTVNDYDIEFARVLANLEAEGYTFERKQYGETVVYALIGDGLEYGRWTIAPPRGREKHVQLMSHATAISRGCDTSMREHGDMEHLPEEERRRHAVFVAAEKKVMSAIEFTHGLGDWADFWREHDAQHAAQAEPVDEDAAKLPGRAAERREWVARWEKIRPLVEDGKSIAAIQSWLDKHASHLWASEETLRKNIAWGQAGAKT